MRKSVKDAVYVEKKKKKHVQAVEVPTTTKEAEPKPEPQAPILEAPVQKQEVPTPAPAEKPIVVSAPLKNILTRINSLKPKDLALIEQFGLPVKDFAEWMFMMEQALGKVANLTEKGIAEELYKKSMEQRQQMQQQTPSTGNQGGGGGIGDLIRLAAPYLQGGGSSEMQDKIMNMALESMGLGNALVKAIIIKTAPELAAQLIPPIGVPKP